MIDEKDEREYKVKDNVLDAVDSIGAGWLTTMAYVTATTIYDSKKKMDQNRFNSLSQDGSESEQNWHKQIEDLFGDSKLTSVRGRVKKNDLGGDNFIGFVCLSIYKQIPWSTTDSFTRASHRQRGAEFDKITQAENELLPQMGGDYKMKNLINRMPKMWSIDQVKKYIDTHLSDLSDEEKSSLIRQWQELRSEHKEKYQKYASPLDYGTSRLSAGTTDNTKNSLYIYQNMFAVKPENKTELTFALYQDGHIEGPINRSYKYALCGDSKNKEKEVESLLKDLRSIVRSEDAEYEKTLNLINQYEEQHGQQDRVDVNDIGRFLPRKFNVKNIIYIVGASDKQGEDNEKFIFFNNSFDGMLKSQNNNKEIMVNQEQIKSAARKCILQVAGVDVSEYEGGAANQTPMANECVKRLNNYVNESIQKEKEDTARKYVRKIVEQKLKEMKLI